MEGDYQKNISRPTLVPRHIVPIYASLRKFDGNLIHQRLALENTTMIAYEGLGILHK